MTRIPISPSESQVVHGFPIWNPFFVKQPGWNMMIELMIRLIMDDFCETTWVEHDD